MADRSPIVAGRFYPARPSDLEHEVRSLLSGPEPAEDAPRTILAMVPHAGYAASGLVAGKTMKAAKLARKVLLLGPNHTGMGKAVAVWPDGRWTFPGGSLRVDVDLASALIKNSGIARFDTAAHRAEHSLEVILPFLYALDTETAIVPICVSLSDRGSLLDLGRELAQVMAGHPEPVSLVVSSDMSHYLPHETAKNMDRLALERISALDPSGLFDVVVTRRISMCGVLPMTAALQAAVMAGAREAVLVSYATSGDTLGDYSRVVGYAGFLIS
ncbi:MAG: AmmeMemoRadiSam system protein B [Deltaproteobacteria bacterium]|nr:AmmeMemoRadiSam system protein B [Deltaproteobacteria bacterium]